MSQESDLKEESYTQSETSLEKSKSAKDIKIDLEKVKKVKI